MANLLESLLEGSVQRSDKHRLTVSRRPFPERPRDVFDAFAVMGHAASLEGLMRAFEFKHADPRMVAFAALGRWPTWQELTDLPDPYKPQSHLRRLVLGAEFRRGLAARMLLAFPEKRRLLHVSLPRGAGARAVETMSTHHPVLPLDLDENRFRDHNVLMPAIGAFANLFETTRTLAVSLPAMAAFVTPGRPGTELSALHWDSAQPPCRVGDLLFAVLRPPRERALSAVNAALHALRAGDGLALPAPLRGRIGPPPEGTNLGAWRNFGRALLPEIVSPDPVCRALGDGTAAGTLEACACVPIQLVALPRFDEWARVAIGPMETPRRVSPEPILRAEDLAAAERDMLDGRTAEDRAFYARFDAKLSAGTLPAVAGPAL